MFDELGLPDDALIVDVGANIGYQSVLYALARPNARIIALEPSRTSFGYLVQNTASFPVFPLNVGAGHEPGFVTLGMPTPEQFPRVVLNPDTTGLMRVGGLAPPAETAVMVRLDDLLAGLTPDFIKIDVEAYEKPVLEGAVEILESASPLVQIETGLPGASDAGELLATFKNRRLRQSPDDETDWVYGP